MTGEGEAKKAPPALASTLEAQKRASPLDVPLTRSLAQQRFRQRKCREGLASVSRPIDDRFYHAGWGLVDQSSSQVDQFSVVSTRRPSPSLARPLALLLPSLFASSFPAIWTNLFQALGKSLACLCPMFLAVSLWKQALLHRNLIRTKHPSLVDTGKRGQCSILSIVQCVPLLVRSIVILCVTT